MFLCDLDYYIVGGFLLIYLVISITDKIREKKIDKDKEK